MTDAGGAAEGGSSRAFVLWSAAAAVAYGAQHWIGAHAAARGWWLYALAALLAIAAAVHTQAPADARPSTHPGGRSDPAARRTVGVLAALSILLAVVSPFWVAAGRPGIAGALWIGSMTAAVRAARAWDRDRAPVARRASMPPLEIATLLGVLAVALLFRLPYLATIPPEVHGDEAACGLAARQLLSGEASLFDLGWYDLPNLGFGISAASMAVFGDDLFGLRMASVILGVGTVALTYFIARRLCSPRVAAIAALLLAVGHWPVHFGRSGIHYMQATFAAALLFLFWLRGVDRRRALDFLLAGFAAGLCVSVYFGSRIAPVLVVLFALHGVIREPVSLRLHAVGLATLVLGAVVFLAPQAAAYARAPGAPFTRAKEVWIFSPRNLRHSFQAQNVASVAELMWSQADRSLEAFHRLGETSAQYDHQRPLLDFWTGPLLVLGLATIAARPFGRTQFFLGAWFWLTLCAGSMLTVDALFSPRVVALMPALFIIPALALDAGWKSAETALGRGGSLAFALVAALLLGLATRANFREYFLLHVTRMQPAGFSTVLSAYVRTWNDRYRVYFLSGRGMSLGYDTSRFLVPDFDGQDVGDRPLALPLASSPSPKGALFLVDAGASDAAERLAAIEQAYPRAHRRLVRSEASDPLFFSVWVEHGDL